MSLHLESHKESIIHQFDLWNPEKVKTQKTSVWSCLIERILSVTGGKL